MVQPVQSSVSAPSMPFQKTAVNPLYQDQFGISTLTQATSIRKPLIVLGFLAVVAVLIIFLKKLFSTKSEPSETEAWEESKLWKKMFSTEPTEIQAWVESNCADLNLTHRKKAALVILMIREFQQNDRIINVKGAMNDLNQTTYPFCLCDQCNTIKAHILRYFEQNRVTFTLAANVTPEVELRKRLSEKWPNLSEDSVKLAIERYHAMESSPEFNNTKDIGLFPIIRWGNLEIDACIVSKPV